MTLEQHVYWLESRRFESAVVYYDMYFFYKQLGSGLNRQSCLYFQGFRGSKLLNGYLVFDQATCVCEECNNFPWFELNIYDQWFYSFFNSAFETADIVGLAAILGLLQSKNSTFL